jgi:hypothetical protein
MKTAKFTLMFLACAAALPAVAQNTTDARCGTTNFDGGRGVFTIVNPTPGMANQQCFITVVPKDSWTGGAPVLASSQLVEGNYEISLSGGGGGGGGGGPGADSDRDRAAGVGGGGEGGGNAPPVTMVRYLTPGVYRLTIGAGGPGGAPGGGHGGDGAPTSLSNAHSGDTLAGFAGAEAWEGTYNSGRGLLAYYSGSSTRIGERAPDGRDGASNAHMGDPGVPGVSGFITIALKDPVPEARTPVYVAPAAPPMESPRPARRDRN